MTISRTIALLVCAALLQACASGVQQSGSPQEAAEANLNLGAAYLRQGRPDLALERLDRALVQNPRLALAHSTIALAYEQLGDERQAEQHYRRATQLEPDNPSAANSYAVFLCRQGRWGDAERHFRSAAANPRYATPAAALTNAGFCARDTGDHDKADEYFRAALERDPGYADALSGLMEMAYQAHNYLQARAFLQRYLDVQPPDATILWYCVQIERELGDRRAEERCARQLRENFPGSAEVAQLNRLDDAGR
jgi:type IV pilus assembly protein PilF